MTAKARPPPPPPSMRSPKYLLSLSPGMNLSHIGIAFKPSTGNGAFVSDNGLSVDLDRGATIGAIASSPQTLEWKNKYGMKKGDELYKINGTLVKHKPFKDIVAIFYQHGRQRKHDGYDNVHEPMTLIFEKKVGVVLSHNPRENQEMATLVNDEESKETESPSAPQNENNFSHIQQTQFSSKIEDVDDNDCSDRDISVEKNILSSIFSPQNNISNSRADDSMLSEYHNSENNVVQHSNLTAIPEGGGSDACLDVRSETKLLEEDYASVPPETVRGPSHLFPLASPTFSYSVTTANDEDFSCAQSPFDVGLSSASISIVQTDCHRPVDANGIKVGTREIDDHSSKEQYYDSQVESLKQKYAPYLSPSSSVMEPTRVQSQPHTLQAGGYCDHNNFEGALKRGRMNRFRRHRSTLNDASKSIETYYAPINTSANDDDLPCRVVDCVPSMESCSISTVFMSPQQDMHARTAHALMPISEKLTKASQSDETQRSNALYKDIPISMLDYKSVRQCESAETMKGIIDVLESSSPPEFPSLLRLAKRRLIELRAACGDLQDLPLINRAEEESENNVTVNKMKGGVPSHIHVEVQANVDGELHLDNYVDYQSQNRTPDCEEDEGNDMDNIVMAHAELQGEMEGLIQERNVIQEDLTSQIRNLEKIIGSLNAEMGLRADDSNERIKLLRQQKANAEDEMNALRKSCSASSIGVQQLIKELKIKEEEIGDLAAELFKVKESKHIDNERSESIQTQLQAKIESLTHQLKLQVEKTEGTRRAVVLELKSEYDDRSKKENELLRDVKVKLKETTNDLNTLYAENQFMANEFAKVGLHFDNPGQFRGLLKEFAAAEAAANALAKALTESETELSTIVWQNREYQEKIKLAQNDNVRLSLENEELNVRILAVDQELSKSNDLVDALQNDVETFQYRQKHYEKLIRKCKDATEIYKSKVSTLRSQMAEEGKVVTLEAYKKVVHSSECLSNAFAEKQAQVQHLKNRIRSLESIVEKRHSDKMRGGNLSLGKSDQKGITVRDDKVPQQRLYQNRAALMQKMVQKARFKNSLGARSKNPLESHNCNVSPAKYMSTSVFVGKENM